MSNDVTTVTSRVEAIVAQGLNKWFGAHHVLHDIDIAIGRGEHVVVCGPSGSGKSTLVRCFNGLEPYRSGRLTVNGHDMSVLKNASVVRQNVGMVFQQFNLFPHMTVLENCTLAPIWSQKLPSSEAADIAMELLRRVHIAAYADRYPGQLSGGQQQRVAIARALCMRPNIMLFDEPTSALDPEMIAEVLDVMIDLAKSNITMVCVTHEMGFARAVANRIVFMADGRIVEEAEPQQFFENPRTERAQKFLRQVLPH
ncbi:amino acid ABC transporter ATP-binding protein [Bradyrhizobium sp. KB893862 SZCCT0404]|uniref:amino acid ABC transporter ATP-binding protein n=1 Tax=Bradyrhizobium sp. KB893862 SZCCT0404 TaxID=2807672 RepID=UPI001BAD0812|nr:amino acid ABC transporter ATP-binding protein [Bradyrhizobium sp. KB893862 SZCCT0404]MBR1175229.1 amino acid ABC transporter ATP-binding protein [Bradyrhizobium sp. KB893862 SZCCT0404]